MSDSLIHIIPTLQNGGAETVLTSLVEEFSKVQYEQVVISIQGDKNDFNYEKVARFSTVIHAKEDSLAVKEVFQKHPEAKLLAWMYKGVLKAHQWKHRFRTDQKIIWNIRNSNFRYFQIRQRCSLYAFGLLSHMVQPKIIYCSYQAKKVHTRYFFSKRNQCVIPNRWAKERENLPKVNPPETPNFLYVGRYDTMKGPKRLMRIFKEFTQQHPSARLKIAGSGWTSEMIPPFIQDKVTLLGNTDKIYEHYASATALLFTSYSEGYPNVLVEAMISGLPIIAFEAGDSKRILEEYTYGYSVNTKHSFLEMMQKMSSHPFTIKERMVELSIQKEKLNFRKTVDEYQQFLFF